MAPPPPPLVEEKLAPGLVVLSRLAPAKLRVVVKRVADTLHVRDRPPFSDSELDELRAVMGGAPSDVDALIELVAHVLERAAQTGVRADSLEAQLCASGLHADAAAVMREVWQSESSGLRARLRDLPLPQQRTLLSVDWQAHVHAMDSSTGPRRSPGALLQLNLASGAGADAPTEHVSMYVDRDGLHDLLAKLDLVQQQLDALSEPSGVSSQ